MPKQELTTDQKLDKVLEQQETIIEQQEEIIERLTEVGLHREIDGGYEYDDGI